jgi:hypothetical protein
MFDNPLARTVRSPYDLAADPRPAAGGLPDPVQPGDFGINDAAREQIARRIRERTGRSVGHFAPFPFLAQIAAAQIIPAQPGRFYFFICNNNAANRIFVGFDYEPNALNGVILEVNLGFYEPWIVPTNGIFIAAAGANTAGIAIVAFD